MRIVSLLSSATEILFALGLGKRVVAISHECDYPPEATKLPRATGSRIDSSRTSHEIDRQVKDLLEAGEALYELDEGLLRDLKPDLIVTQAQCDVCAVRYQDVVDFVAEERALASTQVLALNPQSLDDVLADIASIAVAARARQDVAAQFLESLENRRQRVQRGSSAVGEENFPRVVIIEWTSPLMTAGNWTPGLVREAGGLPLLAIGGRHSEYAPWEKIVAAEPEVLIIAPCGFDLARSLLEAKRVAALPGYASLPAVRSGRVFVIDGNAYLNRSGPRLIDSLELLAHMIQPEILGPATGTLAEGRAWARLL